MDSLPINLADLIVIIVLVVSGIFAFVRGFVHEVFAIGSWIAATFVTLYAFPHAQPLVEQYIPTEFFASLVTGVVIFLVSLVVFSMLTRLLSNRVQESSLGALDRSLGLLFGFARGGVIVVLSWLALTFLMPEEDIFEWVKTAKSRPLVERGAELLLTLVPEGMLDRGNEAAEEARRRAEELREHEQTYRQLVSPLRKADAPTDQQEYNEDMRGEIEKAIEGLMSDEPASGGKKQ